MKITEELTPEQIAWNARSHFWSGGKDTVDCLTLDELIEVLSILEDFYPDGIDATTLNDIFWFDREFIEETIGHELLPNKPF